MEMGHQLWTPQKISQGRVSREGKGAGNGSGAPGAAQGDGGAQSGEKEEPLPLFWGNLLTLSNSLTEG